MPPPAYKLGELVATREAYGTALGEAGRARSARRRARLRRRQLDLQRPLREAVPRSLLPGLHRRAGDDGRGDGAREPRRHRVPVDVRLLPQPGLRLRAHGQHQHAERQDGRLARRRLDRRGRPVADGARGSRDDARRAATAPCSIRPTRSAPSACSRSMAYHHGPAYMRTSRPKTPVIYAPRRAFPIGGSQGAALERGRHRDARRRRRHALRGARRPTTC